MAQVAAIAGHKEQNISSFMLSNLPKASVISPKDHSALSPLQTQLRASVSGRANFSTSPPHPDLTHEFTERHGSIADHMIAQTETE
jgi:hypothetical protein